MLFIASYPPIHTKLASQLFSIILDEASALFVSLQHSLWMSILLFHNCVRSHHSFKGAGLFQSARQTKEQAAGRGTSRYPNGIKCWPEPIGNWILMKIIFLRHKISHLWPKIAIVWAIFGQFWPVFANFCLSVTQLCSLWEPFKPEHSWPMWGQGLKPF